MSEKQSASPLEVPGEIVALLAGVPEIERAEQAFALLTVDTIGFPHVCLLSRAELDADEDEVRAAIASPRSAANLRRDRRATLVAVEGVTAHYLKLNVERIVEIGGRLGVALTVEEHVADSLDVALEPIRYTPSAELRQAEAWAQSARCLDGLRASKLSSSGGAATRT